WAVALPTFLRTCAFFLGSAAGAAVFSGAAAWVGLLLDMGRVLSSLPQDLLVGDGLARPLARTRVAARALAADGEAAAGPPAAVAGDLPPAAGCSASPGGAARPPRGSSSRGGSRSPRPRRP